MAWTFSYLFKFGGIKLQQTNQYYTEAQEALFFESAWVASAYYSLALHVWCLG